MQEDLFAKRLSQAFRLSRAPFLGTRDGASAAIVAVELRCDAPGFGVTGPIAEEDADLLCLHLREVGRLECWEGKRSLGLRAVKAGSCTVHDLRRQPFLGLDEPFHILAFRLPESVRRRHARGANERLGGDEGLIEDDVLANLARSLLPFLDGSVKPNQRCIEFALQAVGVHVSSAHGGAEPARPVHRGGLAPWQQRRAQDLLRSHLAEGISLDAVARACSLSASGFLRAFRTSVGIPPHQWLLRCRVDRAAELMRDRQLTLSEIAVSSGFFDQSHFTRAFSQRMGLSPGAWRKAQACAP